MLPCSSTAALSVTFWPNAITMRECSMAECHLYHEGTAAQHLHMQQTNITLVPATDGLGPN